MAGVSVIIADTDAEAEFISTSYYGRVIGILTGDRGQMEAPFEMTNQLREVIQQPAVQQMSKYAFIGSKETVKNEIRNFLELTQVNELIVATHVFSSQARIKSYKWFAELMQELNEE